MLVVQGRVLAQVSVFDGSVIVGNPSVVLPRQRLEIDGLVTTDVGLIEVVNSSHVNLKGRSVSGEVVVQPGETQIVVTPPRLTRPWIEGPPDVPK